MLSIWRKCLDLLYPEDARQDSLLFHDEYNASVKLWEHYETVVWATINNMDPALTREAIKG